MLSRLLFFATCLFAITAASPGRAASAPGFAPAIPTLSDVDRGEPIGAELSPRARQEIADGVTALAKNKLDLAAQHFQALLKLAPDNPNGLVNLGVVEVRRGHPEEARKYLERAVRIRPDAALAWMTLGIIHMNARRHEAATAALAQAVALNPRDPRVHNYFAVELAQRGWYLGAEDELRHVVELEPDFADGHYNLAVLYLQQSPPSVELARRHYEKALQLGAKPDPDIAAKLAAARVRNSLP